MKALIAMSGGVDSSAAAFLMKQRGYECVGCTMRLQRPEFESTCCSLDDVEDARSVARRLGVPYYVFDFSDAFREKVIDPFIAAYEAGRTPNPCILCNRCLKFEKLYERARQLGCECIVTGHYARIERAGERYVLKKALDSSKDQSYVLYSLTQEQLAHTVFPLGGLSKAEVRKLAEEQGFVNAHKPDSQDICFVPDGDYAAVIARFTGTEAPHGDFITADGRVLGTHRGIVHYTIGQRKGLGVSSQDEPYYVCAIDPEANTVTLGKNADLFRREADAEQFHWISGCALAGAFRCRAKIRYRHPEQAAVVTPLGEHGVHIVFDEPQRAITPGQATVLYDGDTVLGGGVLI